MKYKFMMCSLEKILPYPPIKKMGGLFFALLLSVLLASCSGSDGADTYGKFEPGEDKPGGVATATKGFNTINAFSQSSGNMHFKKEMNFKIGNAMFRKVWVSSPASTKSSDGLGPLFNARSCQRCHLKDGRGHPPEGNFPKDDQVSMFLRLSVPPKTQEEKELISSGKANVIGEPTYGTQLQDLSVQGHKGEGHMDIAYKEKLVKFLDGEEASLRVPTYTISNLGYGPLAKDVMMSPRVAPQMIGLGLLELIPKQQILKNADEEDQNKDGISGKANWVWSLENNKLALGRFGLKAGNPSVKQQTAGAFAGDIGIGSSMVKKPSGDCTASQAFCLKAPNGNSKKHGVEINDQMLNLVTFYAQNLAVPPRRKPKDKQVLKGKGLFHKIGCAGCHTPSFTTGVSKQNPHLSNQKIWPYTDLLLHDMGEGLADHRPEAKANGREWKTPPLWGVGLTKQVSGHMFLLHDGRARGVKEAILWHGGEAEKSKQDFLALPKAEREALLAFVKSL